MRPLTLLLLIAFSCGAACDSRSVEPMSSTTPSQAASEAPVKNLCQHWRRAYEEEREGENVEVYRPKDAKQFPPSRFRMAYIFHADGACEWYYLSPDDDHRFKPGKWEFDRANGQILVIQKQDVKETYRMVELTSDVLRLARVPTASKAK